MTGPVSLELTLETLYTLSLRVPSLRLVTLLLCVKAKSEQTEQEFDS